MNAPESRNPNPYESPRDTTHGAYDGQLLRIGCISLVALGGVFFLWLVGEAFLDFLFPDPQPVYEPYFEPIPTKEIPGNSAAD